MRFPLIPPFMAIALFVTNIEAARGAEVVLNARVDSLRTSNVFGDISQEWDFVLRPAVEIGADFADYWSLGYGGEFNYFTQHSDLISHWHEAYLFLNPAWGQNAENEFTLELRGQWLSNSTKYSAIDIVVPNLLAKLTLEPNLWLRWRSSLEVSNRFFYHDSASNSFDVKAETSLTFTFPSRTTLTPRVAGGVRRYVTPITVNGTPDDVDYLLEVGLHASQALWTNAGLQLSAYFLPDVSNNAIIESKLAQGQFSYLGEDFLFSGHRAKATFKQILSKLTVEASFQYEVREYGGWNALDNNFALINPTRQRRDTRLTPRLAMKYAIISNEAATQHQLGVEFDYRFTRQISNSAPYDTQTHFSMLGLYGSW